MLCELESVRVAVMITTDKVYHNNERFYPYREDEALGGYDPYSAPVRRQAKSLLPAIVMLSWQNRESLWRVRAPEM